MDMEKVKVLYTIGDSFVYGHGLDSRWSTTLSKKIGGLDCNVSLTGSSNDRTFRTVVRDISRIESEGKVWSETTNDIDCQLSDLLVIVGWTSPFRFEWFHQGEYYQSRLWSQEKKWNYNDGRIDYKFSDEISKPIVTELNSLVKFFTQIISLKNFLENKNIPNIFFNCFFPFGENTIEYYDNIVDDLEKNKISKLRTFDNIDTYYSLHALWDCVPSDYKELNHLEFIGEENLDESLHPTPRGHELWSDKLFDYGKYD